MEGELAGKKGLVPSNMIEEITDMDKLQSLIVDHLNNSSASMYEEISSSKYITHCFIGNHIKLLNGCLSQVVKARYSYNPGVDSPNESNADVREKSVDRIIFMVLSSYRKNYLFNQVI